MLEEIRMHVVENNEHVVIHPETNTSMVFHGNRSLDDILSSLGRELTVVLDGKTVLVTEALTLIANSLK